MNPGVTLPSYQRYTPHSILHRDYWDRVASSSATQSIFEKVKELSDESNATPAHPRASDFLAAKRFNDRSRVDRYWQHTRTILGHLVVQRCIDGDIGSGVDDTLLDWLWSFLTAPTWVVSAHIPGNELPFTGGPQLDLAACEMAANLAESLEMLKPWIDNQSCNLAPSIVYEIDRRVLKPFVDVESQWWYDPATAHNNWTGVCAGTILAACESLAAIGHPRPEAREKAIRVLNLFLEKAFTPAGECDEGVGYWSYGVGFACLGWSRLSETEFRAKVNVDRLRQVADYPRQVHLFENTFFSGNDATYHAVAPVFATRWLAGATGVAWLIEWERAATQLAWNIRNPCVTARAIAAKLESDDQPPRFEISEPVRFIPDQQVAILTTDRLVAYLSGGHNAESHNHNDLGQFGVFCDRELIIIDLGAPYYTSDFFGSKRYTYLSASSRGHCVPIINGQEQIAGRDAAGKVVEIDPTARRFAVDLTAAYPAEAKLSRWVRTMAAEGDSVRIVDEFATSNAGEIESVIWSRVEPARSGPTLRLKNLTLRVQPECEWIVEAVDPASHKLREFTQTLYRISYKLRTGANAPLRTSIMLSA